MLTDNIKLYRELTKGVEISLLTKQIKQVQILFFSNLFSWLFPNKWADWLQIVLKILVCALKRV